MLVVVRMVIEMMMKIEGRMQLMLPEIHAETLIMLLLMVMIIQLLIVSIVNAFALVPSPLRLRVNDQQLNGCKSRKNN